MKPLILSNNTGGGHNSAAKAIREQLMLAGYECRIMDGLAFASENVSKFICKTYERITINAPAVFGAFYKASAKTSNPKMRSISYMANTAYAYKLYKYLRDNEIDTVITSHIFAAECLTHIRKHYDLCFKFYLVVTDYDRLPFAEETSCDAIFIPHEALIPEYTARGIKEDRLLASGIPTASKFSIKIPQEEARKVLNLAQEVPQILIMTGSMGNGNAGEMIKLLRNRSADSCITVMGGNNERLKSDLRARFAGDRNVRILDFTSNAELYMDACDVLLTKPGGLTSTEAAVKNIPLVHTDPIPGCESGNLQFFTNFGLSVTGKDRSETADKAIALLMNREMRERMKEAQRLNINPHAAADIVRYVIDNDKR